jgi:hypothetical protein
VSRKQLLIDYHNTFASPEGQRVLADLRKLTPLLTGKLDYFNGVNTNMLLVLEGQSNVLKHIYQKLGKDPNEDTPERVINRMTGE